MPVTMQFMEKRSPPKFISPEYTAVPVNANRVRSSGNGQMTFDPSRGGWVAPASAGSADQRSVIGSVVRTSQWMPGLPGDGNLNLKGNISYMATAPPEYQPAHSRLGGKYDSGISSTPWAAPPMAFEDESPIGLAPGLGPTRPRYKGPTARDTNVPLRGGCAHARISNQASRPLSLLSCTDK